MIIIIINKYIANTLIFQVLRATCHKIEKKGATMDTLLFSIIYAIFSYSFFAVFGEKRGKPMTIATIPHTATKIG